MSEVKRSQKSMTTDLPQTYLIEIRPGGPVKIGKTNNIPRRMAEGACFNDQLKLLAVFPDMGDTSEKALHLRFDEVWIDRELFDGDTVREWLTQWEV